MVKHNGEMTRRISFLKEFDQGGCFEAFTKLVQSDEELELLFRGNSGDNGKAIIYYKNNKVFDLEMSKDGKVAKITINYNHLRYSKDWPEIILEYEEYGFPKKEIKDINPEKNYGLDYVTAKFLPYDVDKIDEKYVNGLYSISKKVMADFFCLEESEKCIDRFRESYGVSQTGRAKPNYLEKSMQQAFFSANSKLEDGLFVYDLEYKEPFESKIKKKEAMQAKQRKKMNKPDCLAIRFNDMGKPESFAFIEIKSKKEAERGQSGTSEHLDGMMDDLRDSEFVNLRIKEANQLIHDYQTLELKGLKKYNSIPNIEEHLNDMKKEIIIVYTDESAEGRKPGYYMAKSEKYEEGVPYSVEIFK